MTFHKDAEEANTYVWVGYGPETIYQHAQGQVSGSMNADPINYKKIGQKSTTKIWYLKLWRTILDEKINQEILITYKGWTVVKEIKNSQNNVKIMKG